MNEKKYKSAMKNIKTSSDFNENTMKMLSDASGGETKREKYKRRNIPRYLYGAVAACLLLVFLLPSMLNDSKIQLENSTGNVKVKYVDRVPDIRTENELIWLSEDEIFNKYNTSIFKGEVMDLKNIEIEMGMGSKEYRAIATIKILDNFRGNETTGDIVKILLPAPINMYIWVEDTEVVSTMNIGDIGIFMPLKYDESHIWRENDATLYLKDISEYGFLDGERYAFIQKDDRVVFANWAYESISKDSSLIDIERYVLDMIN